MAWVTDAWGRGGGEYSTARSAFWRHVRGVLASIDPNSAGDPSWSSRLAWSNLAKVAPSSGGNPTGNLLDVQLLEGHQLLTREIEELRPQRVLVLAGRQWFAPFAARMSLDVQWDQGLVEGVAQTRGTTWVIAKHPQGKPRRILDDVVHAFGDTERID